MTTALTSTSLPTQNLNTTTSTWRNRIHTMLDGTRAVLYGDGSVIKMLCSVNGTTTWAAPIATISIASAINQTIDSFVVGDTLYIIAVNTSGAGISGAIYVYSMKHNGGTSWGGLVGGTALITTLPAPAVGLRAAYGSTCTTIDSNHVGGTSGLIFLVVDMGTQWIGYALDPNSTVTGGVKIVVQTPAFTYAARGASSGATNLCQPQDGSVFCLGAGASAWIATMMTYTSKGIAQFQQSSALTSPSLGTWFSEPSSNSSLTAHWLQNSTAYSVMYGADGSNVMPPLDSQHSNTRGWGFVFSPAYTADASVASGTWTATLSMTSTNVSLMNLSLGGRLYEKTVSGTYRLLGTLVGALTNYGSSTYTLTAGATLAAQTISKSSQFYAELYITMGASGKPTTSGTPVTIALNSPRLNSPTSSSIGYAPDAVAFGALETPSLALSPYGAAMMPSDTSATPGVDLVINTGSAIAYQTRTTGGGYSAVTTLAAPTALAARSPACSLNLLSGDKAIFAMATFSSVVHVGLIRRTANVWQTWGKEDIDTAGPVQQFCAVSDRSLGKIGWAIAYDIGTANPWTIHYEDNGFVAGGGGPSTPTALAISGAGVSGTGTSFLSFNTTPTITGIYHASNTQDPMAALRILVTHGGGPTTDWDSTMTSYPAGPLSGGPITATYGGFGAAVTNALVGGTTYTLAMTYSDVIVGNTSPSASITIAQYDAPVITQTAPTTTIAALTFTGTFSFTQAQSLVAQSYQYTLLDPVTQAPLWISAVINGPINPATPTTSPTLDITASLQTSATPDGTLVNGQQYLLGVVLYFNPTGAATVTFTGTQTITLAIPPPPVPTLSALVPHPDTTPLSGGYAEGTITQAAATGGQPTPAYWRLYSLPDDGSGPTQIGDDAPALVGTAVLDLYALGYNCVTQVGITSVSAAFIESAMSLVTAPTMVPNRGFSFNDPDDPTVTVHLGSIQGGSGTIQYEEEFRQGRDIADLANRGGPVVTIRSGFAEHTSQTPPWVMDTGYERRIVTIMRAWMEAGTTVQYRTPWGDVYPVVFSFKKGADQLISIRTIQGLDAQRVNQANSLTMWVLP